ncbi:MAG: cyclic nucleotide-binding domain-containing protein [Myxococcota bacterium]|nr:cyclic nucleotide-binding domain-containing protein [Myxococcota bacterium]
MVRGEIEWEFSESEDGSGSFMATNKAINLIRQHLTRGEVDVAQSLYESCAEDVGDELLLELDVASTHLQKSLANLFYRSRDYRRAAKTCVRLGEWSQAARAFQAAGDYAGAAEAYLRGGNTKDAAAHFEKAGHTQRAIELYKDGNNFGRAADVAAASGDLVSAAKMWVKAGDRMAAIRSLSSVSVGHPNYAEATAMLSKMTPERTTTLMERAATIENRDTENSRPAFQPEIESNDPFGALDGAVFDRNRPEARSVSISQLDQVTRRAAARYVTKMEGYDSLKQLALFESLSLDSMRALYHLGNHVNYRPGEILIEQGRPGEALFILRTGKVKVCLINGQNETVVAEMSSGDCLGEMSLIDETPTSARVEAVEETVAFVIRRDALRTFMYRDDRIALKIYKSFAAILSKRLRTVTKQLE